MREATPRLVQARKRGPWGLSAGMLADYMQAHVPAVPAALAVQTQSTFPNVQVLFIAPPLAGVQALFATGVAVGQAIGVTQFQTWATPVAAFWQVHCAGPNVQRLA